MMNKIFVLCIAVYLQGVNGLLAKNTDDLPIKYPGPTKDMSHRYNATDRNRFGSGKVPEECENQNFCTIKPVDYPEEAFNGMFKGSKLGKLPNLVIESGEVDVVNRQGGPGENDDCRAKITYEPLYKVRNKRNGGWRDVVNAEQENYVQKVRLETCVNPESRCFTQLPEVPGFETFCRQKYNDWEIVVSDGKGGTETITSTLPICCSCYYRTVDLASRFGGPQTPKN